MMPTTKPGDYRSVPVDIGNIEAAIESASDALDATANALTGAAGAVSDAYRILESLRSDLAKITRGTPPPANRSNELGSSNEVEIEEGSLDHMSENGKISDQRSPSGSEYESDNQITSSLPPPRSSSKQPETSRSKLASHRMEENLVEDSELDDLIDVLPLSSITPYSGIQETPPVPSPQLGRPVSNDEQWAPSILFQVMKSQYAIPPGRNYIYLGQSSDGLAFIAYMALQANRTICMVPDYYLDDYSELLESLTHAGIHRIHTLEQFKNASETFATLDPCSYNIFLISPDHFIVDAASFRLLFPDCIIHWGQPASAYYYTVLDSLPPIVQTCVILTGDDDFNGELDGAEPYPDTVLNECFSSNSPFQLLCDASADLLSEVHHSVQNVLAPEPRMSLSQLGKALLMRALRIEAEPEQSRDQFSEQPPGQLPAGHYYIVLDKPHNKDLMALIAYVALNSAKVLCHMPHSKNLEPYQRLINLVTGIQVIVQSMIKNRHKVAKRQLKSATNAVLLRSLIPDWCSFLPKFLVDSVIHQGPPKNLTGYLNECRTKSQHSFLVLTKPQYSRIKQQLASNQWIQRHPHIQGSEFSRVGSPLNDLRNQLEAHS